MRPFWQWPKPGVPAGISVPVRYRRRQWKGFWRRPPWDLPTSQWVSVHTQGPLKEILGIPETLILHTLIPIGYPDDSVTLPKGGWREPLEKLVHQDWYEMEKHLDNRQMLERLAKLRTSTKGLYKPMVK